MHNSKIERILFQIPIPGWNFTPHWISDASRVDYLVIAQTADAPAGNLVDMKIYCGHQCLKMRRASIAGDPSACNSFMLDGGQCRLGAVTTEWVTERRVAPPNGYMRIYVDFGIRKCG